MNVLLLGSGGREHALAATLATSPQLSKLWAMPGNPGIAVHATCIQGNPSDVATVVQHSQALAIDLVVVGPEAPLVAGVVDALAKVGIAAFGPTAAAAVLEGSKAFAKEVMQRAGVPTANFEVFDDVKVAAERALLWGRVVVKADGLAAGKGVVVAGSGEEAKAAVLSLGKLEAGKRILLEERLTGPELSIIALCDGFRARLFPPAQDHKQLLDNDLGPNTGGMGAYAPAIDSSLQFLESLNAQIFEPVLCEMRRRNTPFRGALFAGLMLTAEGPKVLEFNCRFGDPETQPLMLLLKEDLLPLLNACATASIDAGAMSCSSDTAIGVVMAAPGYPQSPVLGETLSLPAPLPSGTRLFHAGTRIDGERLVTSGGRVLTVCATGRNRDDARTRVYKAVDTFAPTRLQFRRDIGGRR